MKTTFINITKNQDNKQGDVNEVYFKYVYQYNINAGKEIRPAFEIWMSKVLKILKLET